MIIEKIISTSNNTTLSKNLEKYLSIPKFSNQLTSDDFLKLNELVLNLSLSKEQRKKVKLLASKKIQQTLIGRHPADKNFETLLKTMGNITQRSSYARAQKIKANNIATQIITPTPQKEISTPKPKQENPQVVTKEQTSLSKPQKTNRSTSTKKSHRKLKLEKLKTFFITTAIATGAMFFSFCNKSSKSNNTPTHNTTSVTIKKAPQQSHLVSAVTDTIKPQIAKTTTTSPEPTVTSLKVATKSTNKQINAITSTTQRTNSKSSIYTNKNHHSVEQELTTYFNSCNQSPYAPAQSYKILEEAAWRNFGSSEGLIENLYLDCKGHLTIGNGHLVINKKHLYNNKKLAEDMKRFISLPLVDANNNLLSTEKKQLQFVSLVKGMKNGTLATSQIPGAGKRLTSPHFGRLNLEGMRQVFNEDLKFAYSRTEYDAYNKRSLFPEFNSFPIPLQIEILHCIYGGRINSLYNMSKNHNNSPQKIHQDILNIIPQNQAKNERLTLAYTTKCLEHIENSRPQDETMYAMNTVTPSASELYQQSFYR